MPRLREGEGGQTASGEGKEDGISTRRGCMRPVSSGISGRRGRAALPSALHACHRAGHQLTHPHPTGIATGLSGFILLAPSSSMELR